MQVPSPTPMQSFWIQVMPYVISFLALVIPAVGAWIVSQLKANHTATVQAAQAATTAADAVQAHSVQASAKLDSIEGKVNGAMSALQAKSDKADAVVLAAKDAQIETLKQALPKQV